MRSGRMIEAMYVAMMAAGAFFLAGRLLGWF